MAQLKKLIRSNIRQYTMGIALAVLVIILEIATGGRPAAFLRNGLTAGAKIFMKLHRLKPL